MAEELKTRLTDAQIAELKANLPLADIRGDHNDHRLKRISDEIILIYDLKPSFSGQFTPYHYAANLSHSVTYKPAVGTIVYIAHLDTPIAAIDKFQYKSSTDVLIDSFLQDNCPDKNSIVGTMYIDAAISGFLNLSGFAVQLELWGVTMI